MDDVPPPSPTVGSDPIWRRNRWLPQGAIAVVCVTAALVFVTFLNRIYPVKDWLAVPVLVLWGWLAVLHLGCLSLGTRVAVSWLGVRDRPPAETLVLSMATGVVAWVLAMYLFGALHLYGSEPFFVLPLAFFAAGAGPLARLCARWRDERRNRLLTVSAARPGVVNKAMIAFGTVCLGLMYLQVFSPAALNYDSVWCHLTVAEAYAREGGIVSFPADYNKNAPQLTPLFHLWGFLVPGLDQPPLRWMFALHNEFALFLWTLVGVVAVVGWTLGDARRGRGSWAAFFLFPGIFVYDGNLGGAADHVLAFFSLPVLLTAVRFAEQPSRRKAILCGIVSGGALLTKYQAIYVLAPAGGLLAIDCLRRAFKRARDRQHSGVGTPSWRELALVPGIALLTLTLVASPHFIRNLVFHRNPIYPYMQDFFAASRPRITDGAYLVSHILIDRNWQPKGTMIEKAIDALALFFTFSFKPHYYYEFHHNVPSFGSLFTLLLPLVPFLGRQPRLWRVVGCGSAALLLWAMTFLVDRNLQIILPILVAVTAAIIALGWARGWVARVGVSVLVLLQVIWGADALFYSGHERLRSAVELIATGFAGSARNRFSAFRADYIALGNALPPDATVLLRGTHGQLGINRRVLLDWSGFQGLIDYRTMGTVEELHARFRSLGITHIGRVFSQGAGATKQEDVLISLLLSQHATTVGTFGGIELFAMPATAPLGRPSGPVVMLGVAGYPDGAYHIAKLGVYEGQPGLAHFPRLPDIALPTDSARWPEFFRSAMASVVGSQAAGSGGLMAALQQSQTRLRVTPNSLQIFAPN